MRWCQGKSTLLRSLISGAFSLETLANDPAVCGAVAKQIRASATSVRLAAVEQDRQRLLLLFQAQDRTSGLARQFLDEVLGKPSITSDKVAAVWTGLLDRFAQLKSLARDFETISEVTRAIAAAGAPEWAKILGAETAAPDDPRTSRRGATRGITQPPTRN